MNKFLTKKVYFLLTVYLFLLILTNFLELLGLSSILIFLNFVLDINNPIFSQYREYIDFLNANFINTKNIKFYVYLIIIFYIIKNFISAINIFIKEKITVIIGNDISSKLYQYYISKSLSFHEKSGFYKLFRNVMSETRKTGAFFLNILQIFNDVVLIFLIILFILIANKDLFLITSLLIIPSIFFYYFFTSEKINIKSKKLFNLRYSVIEVVINSFNLIKELKFYNFSSHLKYKFINQLKEYQSATIFIQSVKKLPRIFYEVVILLCILFVLTYLVDQGYDKKNILSFLSILFVAFLRVMPSAASLSVSLSDFKENKVSYDFLKSEISVKNNKNKYINLKKVNKILLKKITFSYNKTQIIKNINFKIENFKLIGIKGESGSGKSTLVKIISNIIYSNKGIVKINNVFNEEYKYYNFGYLDNKPYLFNGSVKDNILFFSKNNNNKIKKILSIVALNQNILKKVAKYNDQDKVSTGQKQRIAIARCLYKNPSLLILDETLSNIDLINTNKIIKNLKKENIPVIIVSHNQKILNKCEKVFELKNKKIFKST